MHPTTLIIADDLTGACDSGLPFARRGYSTHVWLNTRQASATTPTSRVVVLQTASRELSPDQAYHQLAELSSTLPFHTYTHVYKKIDSTMRGNIGKELDALLDTGGFACAIVAPAYPAKGRITVGGYHLVHQKLLEDSEIAHDPTHPVARSRLVDIIGLQSARRVEHLDIECIRTGQVAEQIIQCVRNGVSIFTLDSVNERDLEEIVQQAATLPFKVLWAGSAGLADAISQHWETLPTIQPTNSRAEGPLLIVAGSVSSVTREQVACLREAGIKVREIAPLDLLNSPQIVQEYVAGARTRLAQGNHLVLSTQLTEQAMQQFQVYLYTCGITQKEGSERIAQALGGIAAQLLQTITPGGLILTGGETALQVSQRLGIEAVDIVGEVEDGLPICRTMLADRMLPIVTKAGSFGHRESLLKAIQCLTGRETP